MRLTIKLEPEQLFADYVSVSDIVDIVKVIFSKYRDEALLWNIIKMALETLIADYKDEHKWYMQRQIESAFGDKGIHPIDTETIVETEAYIRAAERIADMVKLLREGELGCVIGD